MIFGTIEDCVFLKDELFVLCKEMRIMYTINIKKQMCTGIFTINDDDPYRFFPMAGLGGKCFEWNGKIVVTPSVNNKLQIYDAHKAEWKDFIIDCISSEIHISRIFVGTIENNYLYFLGCHYPLLMKFNLQNLTVERSDKPYRKYIDKDWKKQPYFYRYGNKRYDDEFQLYSAIDDEMFVINLRNDNCFWSDRKRTIEESSENCECIYRELEMGSLFKKRFKDGREVIQTNDGIIRISIPDERLIEVNLFDEEKRMSKEIKELLSSNKKKIFTENLMMNETQTIGLCEFIMMV